MNQFTGEREDQKQEKVGSTLRIPRLGELFGNLSREQITKQMPFVFYITFLVLLYISNNYYSEKNIREIDKIGSELKELRSEYITSKSELMFKSKQSEIARQLESTGIRESVVPPKKIILHTSRLGS